jgi:two-component system sensor histidine kinase DegS
MTELLLTALETERRYIARELHDGIAQTALQLGLQVGICNKFLERGNLDLLAEELTQLEERIQLASRQIREMISDLRPPALDSTASLDEYLNYVIDLHRRRGGPPVVYHSDWVEQDMALTSPQILALARVAQEALLNIRKHAQAENVRLSVSIEDDKLYMTIADDGIGFDLAEVETRPADRGGAGLANLRARIEVMGGTLAITRDTSGGWTEIRAGLPIQNNRLS